MSVQSTWDELVELAKELPPGSFAAVPFALTTNQSNLVVGYAAGSLRLVSRGGGVLPRRHLLATVGHVFSDRTSRLGCPEPAPAKGAFVVDPRPITAFAADKADRLTVAVRPPELERDAPSGWRLVLTLNSWGDARATIPLSDEAAGVAFGVGPGVGPVPEALYTLALGDARVERDTPIIR